MEAKDRYYLMYSVSVKVPNKRTPKHLNPQSARGAQTYGTKIHWESNSFAQNNSDLESLTVFFCQSTFGKSRKNNLAPELWNEKHLWIFVEHPEKLERMHRSY